MSKEYITRSKFQAGDSVWVMRNMKIEQTEIYSVNINITRKGVEILHYITTPIGEVYIEEENIFTTKQELIESLQNKTSAVIKSDWSDAPKLDGGQPMEVRTTMWTPAPEDVGGEKREEVGIVRVDYICSNCKKGNMRPTGTSYHTNTTQHQNKCNTCGYISTMDKTYPYIEYIQKD